MTTKDGSELTALRFAGDALHILKDLARLEKKHKTKILKAHARLAQALCDMDKDFQLLNSRIDSTIGGK